MTSIKIGNRRLLKLADFLEFHPQVRNHFNLSTFVTLGPVAINAGLPVPEVMQQILRGERECGTTACALGWCPIALPRLFIYDIEVAGCCFITSKRNPELAGWESAREIFRLDGQESSYLFEDNTYPKGLRTTAKQVAARIRKFVAKREAKP